MPLIYDVSILQLLEVRLFGEEVVMTVAQSRREEERKQGWLRKLIVGLGVLGGLASIGIPMAFLVQLLRWMLRHEVVPIVPFVTFLVVVMAVIAASHLLQRHSERYGSGGRYLPSLPS